MPTRELKEAAPARKPVAANGAAALAERPAPPRAPRGFEDLVESIRAHDAKVGVMGLGYVGLPLLRLFASRGFAATGFDVDAGKVERVRHGDSYIQSVSSEGLAGLVKSKKLDATTDFSRLSAMDAVIVCVPTPLTADGRPDVSFIRATARSIAENLRRGQLIVLESTSYPGTTREIVKPELERRGLRCGRDFLLAFSPEREDPGNKKYNNAIIPKIVGGMDEASRRAAATLYGEGVIQVVEVSSCEVAEAAKLLENIYRCVNIALVNEMKMCLDRMGIDVWEVIHAASTKPFGFQAFQPGPGLGGHCIPIDPFYLSWKAREYQFNTRFINLAGEVNIQMPYYVVGKVEAALRARNRNLAGAQVLLLGLAYKRDIEDFRESPAFKLIELLDQKGAKVVYNDPLVPVFPGERHYRHLKVKSVTLTEEELGSKDVVVIATDHSAYDYDWIARHAPLVVDTRNACCEVKDRANIVLA